MGQEISVITKETWDEEVAAAKGIVVVYFWATWCGHCKLFMPVYEEVASDKSGRAKFTKLNCDENPDVANRCKIRGTPTIVFYKKGKEIDQIVGALPKAELSARLEKLLSK